jgi:inner membrane protein
MDNLTHSLVGAMIGQAGLKRKTALAMPTLIIAANLPDIDAACFFWLEGAEHLAFRRGITHGPLAMLILPLLLWAAMLGWDNWRRKAQPERPAVHQGWLLALAYIGCLSHPALDWLNNYGVRLLEPFSSHWSYGDSIFIIDIWLWIGLIAALLTSLRAEKRGAPTWQRPAQAMLLASCAYVFANGVLTWLAEQRVASALQAAGVVDPLVVASPLPLAFWRRDVFWRDAELYGQTAFLPWRETDLRALGQPHNAADPRLAPIAATNAQVRAFLFWSRMPVARFAADGTMSLRDQRFGDPRAVSRFEVVVKTAE